VEVHGIVLTIMEETPKSGINGDLPASIAILFPSGSDLNLIYLLKVHLGLRVGFGGLMIDN
jgi:hypothetical protein